VNFGTMAKARCWVSVKAVSSTLMASSVMNGTAGDPVVLQMPAAAKSSRCYRLQIEDCVINHSRCCTRIWLALMKCLERVGTKHSSMIRIKSGKILRRHNDPKEAIDFQRESFKDIIMGTAWKSLLRLAILKISDR
jgi:hypothetical protein